MFAGGDRRRVMTVSEVNGLVAGMLKERFSDVWLEGEVAGFRAYPSGHLYFTLKDEQSQIQAVCFRQSAQRLKFELEDGLLVLGHGRLEVYAPNGKYQIVLDSVEPLGAGALHKAFEQLKRKLDKEGLFREERKRPLPRLPRVVGIVTSPAGAAIHDMLTTLRRHEARLRVLLCPVQVQGEGAAEQIAEGITVLGARLDVDVVIVGRGGGSAEDLWAFNEEVVARAIGGSRAPVVTGIGHEVDFTIADFVADARAATPTAAAQLVARGWHELAAGLGEQARRLLQTYQQYLFSRETEIDGLAGHRCFDAVAQRVSEARHRVLLLVSRAEAVTRSRTGRFAVLLNGFRDRLALVNQVARILRRQAQLPEYGARLERRVRRRLRQAEEERHAAAVRLERTAGLRLASMSNRLAAAGAKLDALSPLASLGRGYSICHKSDGTIVSCVTQVRPQDRLAVRVSDGHIACVVSDVATEQGG